MRKLIKSILLALVFGTLAGFNLSAQTKSADRRLEDLVDRWLAARQSTMRETSTPADVDKLLALYADDIVYEHPRVKARVEGKTRMREGILAFLGVTRDAKFRAWAIIGGLIMISSVISHMLIETRAKRKERVFSELLPHE